MHLHQTQTMSVDRQPNLDQTLQQTLRRLNQRSRNTNPRTQMETTTARTTSCSTQTGNGTLARSRLQTLHRLGIMPTPDNVQSRRP